MIKGKDSEESELHWRYGGASVWLEQNGKNILIMRDGALLNSKLAHFWWKKKIEHKK